MERVLGVLLAMVLLVGGVAYAFPPKVAAPAPAVGASVEANGVAVREHVGAPQAHVAGPAREMVETALRKMVPGADVEKYMRNATARRAEIQNIIEHARSVREKYAQMAKRYMRINDVMRRTAEQFRVKEREWLQIRQQYLAGEIDENTYFEKTKEFVLSAIDATIDRLEALKETIVDESVVARIDERITELEQLKAEVENAENIDDLRAIYPEVRAKIRSVQANELFLHYARMTIGFGESITAQLDVAAARLAAFVDYLKTSGTYDENMDAQVTAIFAKIDVVKDEFNALSAQLESGEIDHKEFLQEIAKIREQIREIYKEIRELYAQMVKMKSQLKTEARVRTRSEVNAPEDRNTMRVEAEIEGNVSVDNTTVETNTSVETEINSEEQNTTVEVSE